MDPETPSFLNLPAEIRLLIYHQTLPLDPHPHQTLRSLTATSHLIHNESLPVLKTALLNTTTTTPTILIKTGSIKILGKRLRTSQLIRHKPPTIISLVPSWLLSIRVPCFLAHQTPNLHSLPQLNPNFPAPISREALHRRLMELGQESHFRIVKGLGWVLLQLQLDPTATLPHISIQLTCSCPLHHPQVLGCRWVAPDPESVSINEKYVLELVTMRGYGGLAFDVGEILEGCREGMEWPSYGQRLWWSTISNFGPSLGRGPAQRKRLYKAWKWLGVDNRRFVRKLGRAMEGGAGVGGSGSVQS